MKNLKNHLLKYKYRYILGLIFLVLILGPSFYKILDRTKIKRTKPIEYIIVHYTANPYERATARLNARYLQKKGSAGTHYCVDDAEIVQCTEENYVAYGIGDRYWRGFNPKFWLLDSRGKRKVLNHNSLHFEMCLGPTRNDSIIIETTAQQIGWQLVNKGLDISRVLRHHDVTGKRCPYFNYKLDEKGRIDINGWDQKKEDESWRSFLAKVEKYQKSHLERKQKK